MAEGGKKNKENPFSFQSFVQKKTKQDENGDEDDSFDDSEDDLPDDIFESPEISRPKSVKNVKNQLLIADEEFDPEGQKKKDSKKPVRKGENPFSFKKFLKKDPTPPAPSGRPSYTNGGSSGPAPDFANDLPDFVQDHFTTEQSRSRSSSSRSRPRTQSDVSLPDFALDTGSASPKDSSIFPSINAIGNLIHRDDASRVGSSARNVVTTNGGVDNENVAVSPRHAGLPDFLSDSVGFSTDGNNGASNVIRREISPLAAGTDDSTGEVKRLQDENRILRQQLQESRQFAERESKRVTNVLNEMQLLQKRESEETAALENMVQKVEANLQITTKRAVKAENTIIKLKQEVKSLQGQVSSFSAENAAMRSGNPYLDEMRDKTQCIAQQLSSAAQTADQSLRQLLSGVTNLRLMSEILQNVGKLSEEVEKPDSQPEASNTPPPQASTAQNNPPGSPSLNKSKTSPSRSSATPPTQRKDQSSSSKSEQGNGSDKKDTSPSKT